MGSDGTYVPQRYPCGRGGYAISAVDVALWDLKARLLGVGLADLFGRVHDQIPVYGSGGFTSYDDTRMSDQLQAWTRDHRMNTVEIKIVDARGRAVARDLSRVRRAREVVGNDVALLVDANGGYERKQAVCVGRESWARPVSCGSRSR